MVLEIFCVEPIYPQYSGVLETCLTLRYWFFEVHGSERVKIIQHKHIIFNEQQIQKSPCYYKGQSTVSNTAGKYVHEVQVNRLFKLARKKVWLGEQTVPP